MPSRIQGVLDHLKNISHDKVTPLLDTRHAIDPSAGIVLVNVPDQGVVMSDSGYEYHFYGARVLTGVTNFVRPHYHKHGEEPYRILAGEGEMNIGTVQGEKVVWNQPLKVKAGDEVIVQENEVHTLRNKGHVMLDIAIACPKEHLIDHDAKHPEGDRYFTKDLTDGMPPWFPK